MLYLRYLKFKQSIMDFLNLISRASFLLSNSLLKKHLAQNTFRDFLSLRKSINTAYEKYIKRKKSFWIQKLKQPIITIKIMTENRIYYGF